MGKSRYIIKDGKEASVTEIEKITNHAKDEFRKFVTEMDKKQGICRFCGASIPSKDRRIKYCSSKCESGARARYMRERMQKKRQKNELIPPRAQFFPDEKGAIQWTDEMSEKMRYLKENQQSCDEIVLDMCWVCGSKEDLILHHVKYHPVCELKVLCRKCHSFLHHSLLRHKKCQSIIVR